jgi:hypothetical protein
MDTKDGPVNFIRSLSASDRRGHTHESCINCSIPSWSGRAIVTRTGGDRAPAGGLRCAADACCALERGQRPPGEGRPTETYRCSPRIRPITNPRAPTIAEISRPRRFSSPRDQGTADTPSRRSMMTILPPDA